MPFYDCSSRIVEQDVKSNNGVLKSFSNSMQSFTIEKFGCCVLTRSHFFDTLGSVHKEPLTEVSMYAPFTDTKRAAFHQFPLEKVRMVAVDIDHFFRIHPSPQQSFFINCRLVQQLQRLIGITGEHYLVNNILRIKLASLDFTYGVFTPAGDQGDA